MNSENLVKPLVPSLCMQRGGSEDQCPRGVQVRMLGPSTRKPGSQLYWSTVPTGKEPLLVSVRLTQLFCTMNGLTHPEGQKLMVDASAFWWFFPLLYFGLKTLLLKAFLWVCFMRGFYEVYIISMSQRQWEVSGSWARRGLLATASRTPSSIFYSSAMRGRGCGDLTP